MTKSQKKFGTSQLTETKILLLTMKTLRKTAKNQKKRYRMKKIQILLKNLMKSQMITPNPIKRKGT